MHRDALCGGPGTNQTLLIFALKKLLRRGNRISKVGKDHLKITQFNHQPISSMLSDRMPECHKAEAELGRKLKQELGRDSQFGMLVSNSVSIFTEGEGGFSLHNVFFYHVHKILLYCIHSSLKTHLKIPNGKKADIDGVTYIDFQLEGLSEQRFNVWTAMMRSIQPLTTSNIGEIKRTENANRGSSLVHLHSIVCIVVSLLLGFDLRSWMGFSVLSLPSCFWTRKKCG